MTVGELREMYGKADKSEILKIYDELDIDTKDSYNGDDSLLHIAAKYADSEAVALLLSKGLDSNIENTYLKRPLHSLAVCDRSCGASGEDIKKCTELLLDAKASTMRKDDEGKTAVITAAENAAYEMLEVIAEKGAKLTMADKEGNSALHCACENLSWNEENEEAYLKTIKVLLDAGLDPEEKNNYDESVVDLSIRVGTKKATAILLGSGSEDGDDSLSKTGGMNVFQALENKDYDALKAIIETGADINALCDEKGDYSGKSPLGMACYRLDIEAVKILAEAGADINLKNSEGKTALGECLGFMTDRYYDCNHADEKTIPKMMKILTEHGLNIDDSIDNDGNTAIIKACKYIDKHSSYNGKTMSGEIARCLLNADCDVNLRNLEGQTALMLLCENTRTEVQDIQIQLLEADADVALVDKNGNTALMYSAKNSDKNMAKEMAELLFDFGDPNPEAVNNDGKSAMEIAVEADNEPLVKLLLTK